jgi:hypothetical protein
MCDNDPDSGLMPCDPPAWAWGLAVIAAVGGVVKFVCTQLEWFPNG